MPLGEEQAALNQLAHLEFAQTKARGGLPRREQPAFSEPTVVALCHSRQHSLAALKPLYQNRATATSQ